MGTSTGCVLMLQAQDGDRDLSRSVGSNTGCRCRPAGSVTRP
ncbi:hypothetical protein FM113_03795 [Leucobacter sp. 7(1)]|nr:hypothetical protein FM113_03795 [Leucobacter sp. 7(1)]